MDRQRQPNLHLRGALAEAGWTGRQLSMAVNAAGEEIGIHLSYDRTTVAHWLAGTRPHPPVPALLAEVFSRRLGRPVTQAGLGLAIAGPGHAPPVATGPRPLPAEALTLGSARLQDEDAVGLLGALGGLQAAATGHASRSQPAYSLAGLAVPGWPPASVSPPPAGGRGNSVRLTAIDVMAAEHMVRLFDVSDAASGAGYARPAAMAYLATDLGPKLRASAHPVMRRRLFTAATRMSYLCAFMCFDDEMHGLSQQYYRAALRLAAENGDQVAYAITLRAMSVQAFSLGHGEHARQLAETAADSARRAEPVHQAFLYGQLAVARSADGDTARALSSLGMAERCLDRATSATPAIGAYHFASLAHQQAAVLSQLGDRRRAIEALAASVQHRPGSERRSRAITLASLAELQMSAGHLDEAVDTWHLFLDDYPYLSSRRATSALQALRRRIRPHTDNAAARMLMQRATAHSVRH